MCSEASYHHGRNLLPAAIRERMAKRGAIEWKQLRFNAAHERDRPLER
jgi:hypothetical protein